MNLSNFMDLFDRLQQHQRDLLISKGNYYQNPESDRLSNFKEAAKMDQVDVFTVLDGYLRKHRMKFRDIMKDHQKGVYHNPSEIIEVITDQAIYGFLFYALTMETDKDPTVYSPWLFRGK